MLQKKGEVRRKFRLRKAGEVGGFYSRTFWREHGRDWRPNAKAEVLSEKKDQTKIISPKFRRGEVEVRVSPKVNRRRIEIAGVSRVKKRGINRS